VGCRCCRSTLLLARCASSHRVLPLVAQYLYRLLPQRVGASPSGQSYIMLHASCVADPQQGHHSTISSAQVTLPALSRYYMRLARRKETARAAPVVTTRRKARETFRRHGSGRSVVIDTWSEKRPTPANVATKHNASSSPVRRLRRRYSGTEENRNSNIALRERRGKTLQHGIAREEYGGNRARRQAAARRAFTR